MQDYLKTAVYDFRTESEVEQEPGLAPEDAVLIMEGVFLLRPELHQYWDYKIFLHVDFEQVIMRAKKRDQYLFGSEGEIERRLALSNTVFTLRCLRPLGGALYKTSS